MARNPEIRIKRSWKPPTIFRWSRLLTLLGLPWLILDTQAKVSIFLDLKDDKIKGEVKTKGHEGEIEVLSMGFGSSSSSGPMGPGKADFHDISIFKYTDQSTPELMRRLLTGDPISSAKIKFVETISGQEVPVVTFNLKDSQVSSYASGGNQGASQLMDDLRLNFQEFSLQTFSYTDSPSSGTNSVVTWDSRTGKGTLKNGSNGTPPTISAIAAQTTTEDTPTPNISFTVADAEVPTGSLNLAKSTDNPLVVPLAGITLGGTGDFRFVRITPAPDANGSATISIIVSDTDGLSVTGSFTITVNAVNDAPTIQTISDQFTNQSQAITTGINVIDIDSAATSVTPFAFSGNPSLIPAGNITFSGSGAATQMTLQPVTGASGSAQISIRANDGVATSFPAVFTLTVSPGGPSAVALSDGKKSSPSTVEPKVAAAQANGVKKSQQSATTAPDTNDTPSPFFQWRQRHFPTRIADLSISGLIADPDEDGIANLLEYGVGSDPKDPTDGPTSVVYTEEVVDGITYPAIRFNRLIGKRDPSLIIQVELATDQFNWRIKPGDTVEVRSSQVSETHEEVVVRSSRPISDKVRQSMRLHFSLAP